MKMISSIVGIVLLVSALILSFVASNDGEKMKALKSELVTKYVNASTEALNSGDSAKAIKMAKMAIEADPTSKQAFASYDAALKGKSQPAADDWSNPSGATDSGWPSSQPAPVGKAVAADDDMGC